MFRYIDMDSKIGQVQSFIEKKSRISIHEPESKKEEKKDEKKEEKKEENKEEKKDQSG